MDPITVIVMALAAGVSSGALDALKDDAKGTAKAAYAKLRGLLTKKVAGNQVAEVALAQYDNNPKVWEAPLTDSLKQVGAGNDAELVAVAQQLMDLVDKAGSRAGKYNVTIHGGQGIQVGDGNTQTNTFS
jgi:RIP homotypic interaction motif